MIHEVVMRELSKNERDQLRIGICPLCGSGKWMEGPSGGLSTNIYCVSCAGGFNVAPIDYAELIAEPDPLRLIRIQAHAIQKLQTEVRFYRYQAWVLSITASVAIVLLGVLVFVHYR